MTLGASIVVMARLPLWVCLGLVAVSSPPAFADRDRPFRLELGVNTRKFSAASEAEQTAFRTTGEIDPALAASSAVSSSLRFTGTAFRDMFAGFEGEAGTLVGLPGSNLAGAYGVVGGRGTLGPAILSAELVAGRRWVRYSLDSGHRSDPGAWIAEPRARIDFWAGPRVTLGGTVGATLDDRLVMIAGIHLGLHSHDFDRRDLE